MQFLSTIALSAAILAPLGAAFPVGSWNSSSGATQTLALNATTSNGNSSTGSNYTLTAAEIANNVTFGKLDIDLVNNINSSNVIAILSGLDEAGELVLLDENNQWFYPKAEGAEGDKTPLPDSVKRKLGPKDSKTTLKLPDYIYSARVWFADGDLQMFVVKTPTGQGLAEPSPFNMDDPNKDLNWGFAELTNSKTWGLYANLSFVDFVGMALGLKLRRHGNDTTEVKGLPTGGKYKVCNDLVDQAKKDGQPWDQLCINDDEGKLLRVLSPAGGISINKTAFSDYWYPYTNETATKFTTDALTINTQSAAGNVTCTWKAAAANALSGAANSTSSAGNYTSGAGNYTGSLNSTSNAVNLTSSSGNYTGSALNNTSNATNLTSSTGNITSNASNYTSPSLNSTSNASNYTSPSLNNTSNASNYTSPSLNGTSNASNYTSPSLNSTSNAVSNTTSPLNATSSAPMELHCEGDNRPYAAPTAEDIFGCNTGPFGILEDDNDVHKAIVPRLCAAYNRGTFLIKNGNIQPHVKPNEYYAGSETKNWYSAVVHANQLDNRGYAFSYDDVSVDNESDTAGVVTGTNPEVLTIFVGGHNTLEAALLQESHY
jgi:hypothetical protein